MLGLQARPELMVEFPGLIYQGGGDDGAYRKESNDEYYDLVRDWRCPGLVVVMK